jgi:hypothetical protein
LGTVVEEVRLVVGMGIVVVEMRLADVVAKGIVVYKPRLIVAGTP